MAITAGILAGGAVAATAAGAATAGSGDITQSTSLPPPDVRERMGRRWAENLGQLAATQQLGLQSQGSFITAELLRNAGINPIVQDNTAYFNASRQQLFGAQQELSNVEARISELNALKKKNKGDRKQLQQLKRDRKQLLTQIPAFEAEAQNWAQNQFQITGYEQTGVNYDPNTPEGQANLVEKQLADAVSGALRGEYENPGLERSISKERQTFEARMRRNFGADWAGTSGGMRALAEFEDSVNARRFDAGQQQVRDFVPLWQQERGIQSDLSAARAGLLTGTMAPGFALAEDARASSRQLQSLTETRQGDRWRSPTTTQSTDTGPWYSDFLSQTGQSLGGIASMGLARGGGGGMMPPGGGAKVAGTGANAGFNANVIGGGRDWLGRIRGGQTTSLVTPSGRVIQGG